MTEVASGVLSQRRIASRRGSALLWRGSGLRFSPAALALASRVFSISLKRQCSVLAMPLRTEAGLFMVKSSRKPKDTKDMSKMFDYISGKKSGKIAKLQAELEHMAAHCVPASALDDRRDEVIEQCAQLAESYNFANQDFGRNGIAAAIRKLKKRHGQEAES